MGDTTLRTLQERMSTPLVLTGTKRACVALLLRLSPRSPAHAAAEFPLVAQGGETRVGDLEALFILRAVNKRDRWGGQVGLPGGRQQSGETDRQTASREVKEEIGIAIPDGEGENTTGFVYVGRIHDRQVLQGKQALVVSCFVFMEVVRYTPAMLLDASEVAACGWHPLGDLLRPDCGEPIKYYTGVGMAPREHPISFHLSRLLHLDIMFFTKVPLDIDPLVVARGDGDGPLTEDQERRIRDAFFCWGLTLGILNDMLFNQGRLRSRRISLSEEISWLGLRVERVFQSTAHNVAVSGLRHVYMAATGEPGMPFQIYINHYPLMVAFAGLAGAGAVVSKLRSLL
jgi:8-oxo-dGTP pyrophosphatase MutT (NUDIX family)